MPPNVLPAINPTLLGETEEERRLRELEEQRLAGDELAPILPAVLGTPERLARLRGPAATPDVGVTEPGPRPGSPGNPFPPLQANEDPDAAMALGFRDLEPSATNGNGPPANLLEPRQPSPDLAARRAEQAQQATEDVPNAMLPATVEEEGPSAFQRLAPWALGGLAVGSAIRNRDIGPVVEGATGFFAGQQGAEQRRAKEARKAEEQAFRRAPKLSVDTELGSVSGIPLPTPEDAEGLMGVPGTALEMALRDRGIDPESVVQQGDFDLRTDGLGNMWRINRATGEAMSVSGPEGAPVRRQVLQIPGSQPVLIDPTDPTAPAIPIEGAPVVPLSRGGTGPRPTEAQIGRGLRSEGLRLFQDQLREMGLTPQQMREGTREDREAIWLQWRDWLRSQEGFAGADPRLLDSIIEEVIGPRELDESGGGGGLLRLLEQMDQEEGGANR